MDFKIIDLVAKKSKTLITIPIFLSILNVTLYEKIADGINRYRQIRIDLYKRLVSEYKDERSKLYNEYATRLSGMDLLLPNVLEIRIKRCIFDPENGLATLTGRPEIIDYILSLIIAISKNPKTMLQYNGICLYGPSGSGKSKIASVMSFCMSQLGLLSRSNTVTATRTDMAGQYVGHTGLKVRALLTSALETVLFIDEAYQLIVKDSSVDYGYEIAAEMVKFMDIHRGLTITIMAGYEEPMKKMMSSNEGLNRRFPRKFVLDRYSLEDLAIILLRMLSIKAEYIQRELESPDIYNLLYSVVNKGYENYVNGAGDMLDLCDRILFAYESSIEDITLSDAIMMCI